MFLNHLLGSLVLGLVLNVSHCSTADFYTNLKNWSEHNSVLPFFDLEFVHHQT